MFQVLIIGAGVTGLSLAIELLRRGITIRIIDSAHAHFSGSRGKGIQPRSLELLNMMGIATDVLKCGTLYPHLKFHIGPLSIKGWSLGTHDAPSEARPFPNLIMLEQWRTEEILRKKVQNLGGEIELGTGIEALTQTDDQVIVTLTTGETVRAEYAVACDGGRSTTRGFLGLQLLGAAVDQKTSIVADMEVEGLDRKYWHAYPFRGAGLRSLAPLPAGGLFQLQATDDISLKGLANGVQKLTGKKVGHIAWQSRYRHQARMVERYRVGRVFIAGDAAHIHPPSGAQGLNTGLQDACNLGWKLVSALRTGNDSILKTYEAERRPVAADMLGLTAKLHTSTSKSRGDLTNQLGLNYRGSSLALGNAPGTLMPGDRMPDQFLSNGIKLFDVMQHGGATQIMRPNRDHILIRPDGYIAEFVSREVNLYYGHNVVKVDE
ncbi:FAD-dependent monooxygenase [Neokomagataea tanensis]|uniref:FAD-dependent monooxygenase n=1 Tax=Neokomagataea TaxID=1223423 RepID=UPI001476A6F8|nr:MULTISPECIES: FAD-dependent monooxygenase [Neokomagataea]